MEGLVVSTYEQLLNDLRAHPEWRVELRRELFGDDLPDLPGALSELAAAQRRTEERLDALAVQVGELAAAQRRTEERVEGLEVSVGGLREDVQRLTVRNDATYGAIVESRYRDRPWSYFGDIAKRLRWADLLELEDVLDSAAADGRISPEDVRELRRADAVLRGRRHGADVWLVLEASVTVDDSDVDRAASRAAVLRRTGREVLAVVAGEVIAPGASQRAADAGVWQCTDGRVLAPRGEAA